MREKRRHYLNKDSAQLRRMAQDMATDLAWCEDQAEKCGFGAASDHYRRCALNNKQEIAKIHAELEYRGSLL